MSAPHPGTGRLWSDPAVEEVAAGVHRIPLPLPMDGLRAVNVYALPTPEGIVLVDGGWDIEPAGEALAKGLSALGAGPGDVRRCLVTHVHRDHYTHAVRLRSSGGTHVALGLGERASVEAIRAHHDGAMTGTQQRLVRAGAGDLAATAPSPDPAELVAYELPDAWLGDGDRVAVDARSLRVLATPGHTAGHVVYVDDDADLLFAGDHVLPHITPSIGFEPVPSPSPLADYLSSLAAVRAEPDRTLLPAHGPAGGSVHARVDELLEHHRVRLDDTLAALAIEPGPAYGVAQRLHWTSRHRTFDQLDPFNRMLAVNETLAHLLVLAAQGRVDETVDDTEDGDVLLFAPA